LLHQPSESKQRPQTITTKELQRPSVQYYVILQWRHTMDNLNWTHMQFGLPGAASRQIYV
jgi:hypothetical protein